MASPGVRQRATLLSDVTHINKDGSAFLDPAGPNTQEGTLDEGGSGNEVLAAMPHSKSSMLPMLACATVGVVPALFAAYLTPGRWTMLAAAGAAIASTGLLVSSVRWARKLGTLEHRERQLQMAASASENRVATLVAQMRDTSNHDDVTGTLNRRAFLARLDEVLQRDARLQKPMAFLLIDINGFKRINAEAGRMIGDRVLRAVGLAIQASTRGTDFIGRIGGDEFAVVLGECVDPRPAVDRVLVALDGQTTGGANPLPIRVSVGVVTVNDVDGGVDPVHLFRVAEDALASVRGGADSRCAKREYRIEKRSPVGAS